MKQTELYGEVLQFLSKVANESGNFSTDMLANIRNGNIKLQESEIYIRQDSDLFIQFCAYAGRPVC